MLHSNTNLVIGTRGSQLAVNQANQVRDLIVNKTNIKVDIKIIKTKGDTDLLTPLKNINDTSKFNSKSLKRIFELKSGSIFVLPNENENYLMTIVNEKIPNIDINSKSYKNYQNKAKELYVSKIYKSYDSYINQKYKIDIKKNVLKRIENSF